MMETIIYPGMNDEDLESLKETLEKRGIEHSVSPAGYSDRYLSMVSMDGEFYHNGATLLRHLDNL